MELSFESFTKEYQITLKGMLRHTTDLGTDIFGNILRLDNVLGGMEEWIKGKCPPKKSDRDAR